METRMTDSLIKDGGLDANNKVKPPSKQSVDPVVDRVRDWIAARDLQDALTLKW
jgi:hypothetical protein